MTLIKNHRVEELSVAVGLSVVGSERAVGERDGVLTFNANTFREVGGERCVIDDDFSGGINRGGAEPVGGVGAARDCDGAAAAVRSYRRGRLSLRFDCQIFCNHDAAARGHDTARTAERRLNRDVLNVNGSAVACRAIGAAVAAVAEDSVGSDARGGYIAADDGNGAAAHGHDTRIDSVEVVVVAGVRGTAALGHGRVDEINRARSQTHEQGAFGVCRGRVSLIGLSGRRGDFGCAAPRD